MPLRGDDWSLAATVGWCLQRIAGRRRICGGHFVPLPAAYPSLRHSTMQTRPFRMLPALLAVVVCTVSAMAQDSAQKLAFFESRIRPLLVERCYSCHGADTAEAGLRLDVRSGWERGGQRGPAIVPGDPSVSLLMRMVQGKIDGLEMPPAEAGGKLSDGHQQDLALDPRGRR